MLYLTYFCLYPILTSLKKLMKCINIHLSVNDSETERFDTILSPSGTVATLNAIAKENRLDYSGYDGAFPDEETVRNAIREDIERTLGRNVKPAVLFSLLAYNSENTLRLAAELKRDYREHIRTILGGQLVPFALNAYRANPAIDAACIGDGEVLVPRLAQDIKADRLRQEYNHWLSAEMDKRGQFSFVEYENFYQIRERLQAQQEVFGFSQLCIQGLGGPGCAWASTNVDGACDFCALQNISEMNSRSISEQMQTERSLQDTLKPDRIFDVSNQFLPFVDPGKNAQWLQGYITERRIHGVTTPKYTYLTVTSIDANVAPLLSEAGIEEVYVGIDHFDARALKEGNKSHRSRNQLKTALDALQANGIKVRLGLVIGSSVEDDSSLRQLKRGTEWLKDRYADMINSIGIFPVYVLPGSKVYERARTIPAARKIIESFESKGYFTRGEERSLTKKYIEEHSKVSADRVFEAAHELKGIMDGSTIVYDFDRSSEVS